MSSSRKRFAFLWESWKLAGVLDVIFKGRNLDSHPYNPPSISFYLPGGNEVSGLWTGGYIEVESNLKLGESHYGLLFTTSWLTLHRDEPTIYRYFHMTGIEPRNCQKFYVMARLR